MALRHKVDPERVRAHRLTQLEAETGRTEGLDLGRTKIKRLGVSEGANGDFLALPKLG